MENCRQCGGERVLNPKTQKMFCKNKCWLNTPNAQNTAQRAFTQKAEINNEERVNGMKWLNAKNNACLLIAHGKYELSKLRELANKIYKLEPDTSVADIANQFDGKVIDQETPVLDPYRASEAPVARFDEEEGIKVDSIPF